jgi:hypothetical protein
MFCWLSYLFCEVTDAKHGLSILCYRHSEWRCWRNIIEEEQTAMSEFLPPNYRPGVDAGGAFCLHIGRRWPGTTQAGCSARDSTNLQIRDNSNLLLG